MSFSVNTNLGSLQAYNALSRINVAAQKAQIQLATQKKINSVADDTSGYNTGKKLQAQTMQQKSELSNISDAQNYMSTAESALSQINDKLNQIATKQIDSKDPLKDSASIAKDIRTLAGEIDSILKNTNINGTQLLASTDGATATASQTFDVGGNAFTVDFASSSYLDMTTLSSAVGTLASTAAVSGTDAAYTTATTAYNNALAALNTLTAPKTAAVQAYTDAVAAVATLTLNKTNAAQANTDAINAAATLLSNKTTADQAATDAVIARNLLGNNAASNQSYADALTAVVTLQTNKINADDAFTTAKTAKDLLVTNKTTADQTNIDNINTLRTIYTNKFNADAAYHDAVDAKNALVSRKTIFDQAYTIANDNFNTITSNLTFAQQNYDLALISFNALSTNGTPQLIQTASNHLSITSTDLATAQTAFDQSNAAAELTTALQNKNTVDTAYNTGFNTANALVASTLIAKYVAQSAYNNDTDLINAIAATNVHANTDLDVIASLVTNKDTADTNYSDAITLNNTLTNNQTIADQAYTIAKSSTLDTPLNNMNHADSLYSYANQAYVALSTTFPTEQQANDARDLRNLYSQKALDALNAVCDADPDGSILNTASSNRTAAEAAYTSGIIDNVTFTSYQTQQINNDAQYTSGIDFAFALLTAHATSSAVADLQYTNGIDDATTTYNNAQTAKTAADNSYTSGITAANNLVTTTSAFKSSEVQNYADALNAVITLGNNKITADQSNSSIISAADTAYTNGITAANDLVSSTRIAFLNNPGNNNNSGNQSDIDIANALVSSTAAAKTIADNAYTNGIGAANTLIITTADAKTAADTAYTNGIDAANALVNTKALAKNAAQAVYDAGSGSANALIASTLAAKNTAEAAAYPDSAVLNFDTTSIKNNVAAALGRLGNLQQTVSSRQEYLTAAVTNNTATISNIFDADVVAQQIESSRNQLASQIATAMLAQMNSAPQNFLTLFR